PAAVSSPPKSGRFGKPMQGENAAIPPSIPGIGKAAPVTHRGAGEPAAAAPAKMAADQSDQPIASRPVPAGPAAGAEGAVMAPPDPDSARVFRADEARARPIPAGPAARAESAVMAPPDPDSAKVFR